MNIQFRTLHLPPLPKPDARALMDLAGNAENKGLVTPSLAKDIVRNKFASRSNLDEIIQDLENGNVENITALEWVYCIYNKDKWDAKNPNRSIYTSEAIWKATEKNTWLKQKLFWNLLLNYGGKSSLAQSLVNSASVFIPQNQLDRDKLAIIEVLKTADPAYQLVLLCCQKNLTPFQLFNQYQLPCKSRIIEQVLDKITAYFLSIVNINTKHVNWLLQCLEEMGNVVQVKAIEQLLIQANPHLGTDYPKLLEWLQKQYGSSTPNSRWNELSSEAKVAMRKWLGAVSYQDFQKIVNIILEQGSLTDKERRNLKSRRTFWSHYSDRFEKIRILLPEVSANLLKKHLSEDDFSILENDGSETSEVCIFDLGSLIIAEIFRGSGSEIRLYDKKEPDIERILFEKKLSIKFLRYIKSTHHDHVVCWQQSCEKMLRKNGVLPNDYVDYFKGLPPEFSKYSRINGLPEPNSEMLIKRINQLYATEGINQGWQGKIRKLEREAELYHM